MINVHPVCIEIGAELTITGLPTPAAAELIAENTFPNPEFDRRRRLGLWTGNTDKTIVLYRCTPGGLVVPRGTFPLVIATCRTHNLPYRIEDHTVAPLLALDLRPGTLFDCQAHALEDLLRWPTGLLEAPPGSGKTNVGLSLIPRLGVRTLILTHTGELFAQTRQRCREWLGIEAGALGAGQWDLRPISVALIQTLARRDLEAIAGYFGCVLVDEVHHAPSHTWSAILNALPARYKYGLTATAWRKDGLQCLMWRTIGNVTAKITRAEVQRAGKIVVPAVETVGTWFMYALDDPSEWGAMIAALVRDRDRNALIAREVRTRLTPDTRALILSDRIEHVHTLARLLTAFAPVILTGDLPKPAREAAMTAVRRGAQLTIATTSLLGEGVDVPGWDLLFLATPMAGGPRTLQAIGRVTRAAAGKARATVIDFVDGGVPALASAHAQRTRLYRREAAA